MNLNEQRRLPMASQTRLMEGIEGLELHAKHGRRMDVQRYEKLCHLSKHIENLTAAADGNAARTAEAEAASKLAQESQAKTEAAAAKAAAMAARKIAQLESRIRDLEAEVGSRAEHAVAEFGTGGRQRAGHGTDVVIEAINGATTSINVCCRALTDDEFIAALCQASKERNVSVRVIVDQTWYLGATGAEGRVQKDLIAAFKTTRRMLHSARVELGGERGQAVRNKHTVRYEAFSDNVILIDHKTVICGSTLFAEADKSGHDTCFTIIKYDRDT
eukprot:UC1_evm1s713